jgi:hypothetical protein
VLLSYFEVVFYQARVVVLSCPVVTLYFLRIHDSKTRQNHYSEELQRQDKTETRFWGNTKSRQDKTTARA